VLRNHPAFAVQPPRTVDNAQHSLSGFAVAHSVISAQFVALYCGPFSHINQELPNSKSQSHLRPSLMCSCVGLARIIYIRFTYGIFGREITKYTVIHGVHIRFWPTLIMCNHLGMLDSCNICTHTHTHTLK